MIRSFAVFFVVLFSASLIIADSADGELYAASRRGRDEGRGRKVEKEEAVRKDPGIPPSGSPEPLYRMAFGVHEQIGQFLEPGWGAMEIDSSGNKPDTGYVEKGYGYTNDFLPALKFMYRIAPGVNLSLDLPVFRTINAWTKPDPQFIFRGYDAMVDFSFPRGSARLIPYFNVGLSWVGFAGYPGDNHGWRGWMAVPFGGGVHYRVHNNFALTAFGRTGFVFTHPSGWLGSQLGVGIDYYVDSHNFFNFGR
ncbi:MAG: hypothetical protein ACLFQK_00555 [Fibrobacterota bacterium]